MALAIENEGLITLGGSVCGNWPVAGNIKYQIRTSEYLAKDLHLLKYSACPVTVLWNTDRTTPSFL
jgi:hypothetical protein